MGKAKILIVEAKGIPGKESESEFNKFCQNSETKTDLRGTGKNPVETWRR